MYNPAQQQGQDYAPVNAPQELPLLLNRYRVVEQRGSGGFSSVLVCLDTTLGRRVAIKCMPLESAATAGASTLNEALDEARITSKLNHPNIVTVHDFCVRDNIAYLIMEFVDGLTLSELMGRVEGGVLTYDECAYLLDCLSSVLDYAHSQGVLHLDIKPSNVFIDKDGTIKLGDFGMASLASAAGWEGARGGTVGYMPPEQLQGLTVDERTDVFAMAVVLYQALTGASPFAAKDAEASLKLIQKGAKPLTKVESEFKGPVSDCIGRALNPEPGARQDSAGELARAIMPYLGDEADGKDSVVSLMAQVRGETGPSEEAWGEAYDNGISFVERHPHAPALATRLASAATFAALGARFLPGITAAFGMGFESNTVALAGGLALAALGAAIPWAGGIATGALCVLAIFASGAYSPMFLVAVLVIALFIAWYYATAGSHVLSYATTLLASATATPLGSSALAGFTLRPKVAAICAAVGSVLSLIMTQISGSVAGSFMAGSFIANTTASTSTTAATITSTGTTPDGAAIAAALASLATKPSTWILLAGCVASAWLAALFNTKRSAGMRNLGQILALALLVALQLVAARVENDGIWTAPALYDLAVGVTFTVLMCIANAAQGQAVLREDV